MLRLIIGKAGTGKTAAVIREINNAVKAKQPGYMLIVPEQYSHEAERELCRVCGDTLSLYAEVFSFTGLARRIMSQCGGGAGKYLDKGGRLLCMALALNAVGSRLEVYTGAQHKAELQMLLLSAVDEMKTACVTPEALSEAAMQCPGELGRKLSDLALAAAAYEAVVANGHADPTDRLTILAQQIPESTIDAHTHIYIDGFIDFTLQQQNVIEELLRKGADVTVCLTVDSMYGENEIYELSRRAGRKLISCAKELGAEYTELTLSSAVGKEPQLRAFGDSMFSYSSGKEENSGCITLACADSLVGECEYAAAKAIALVRDTGCRWRDIAIAARGFDAYAPTMESIFRHYGVPLFLTKRSDMLEKPLPALISGAYEIICSDWDTDDVISYMRTGLSGLDTDECDLLENYIFKWSLRAGAWLREDDWHQNPEGYKKTFSTENEAQLLQINALRRRLAAPLLYLKTHGEAAETAEEQAAVLAGYFAELKLPELLERRAAELEAAGRSVLAKEYSQLWGIVCSALEQCSEILGSSPMNLESFGQLFTLMLSRYDVGTIPVALDRVSAGDFDRMRRRSIKHLIVLGVSDDRLPQSGSSGGIFSDDERRRLLEANIDLGGAGESELWREFSLIYNTLTLPSHTLTLCYSALDGDGNALHPAFVYNRAKALFDLRTEHIDITECRLSAPAPALTVAAHSFRGGAGREHAAAEYFRQSSPQRFSRLEQASSLTRGRLSPLAVRTLYGDRLRLSASRIDKFASCKFAYFCQYGLNAKPYEPADFTPPVVGDFIHSILENVAKKVQDHGGWTKTEDSELKRIAGEFMDNYVHEKLNDFREKSGRFEYLFNRLRKDVEQIIIDMATELRRSDFEPLDFELNFSDPENKIPPMQLGDGENSLTLTGIADRVDGWVHDGKMYLRIVDYKTGKKAFSLSDVYYGMGLQMLLYLFALEDCGEQLYGHEIVPAGIMYVPARNNVVNLPSDLPDDEAEKERLKKIKRSGMLLDDSALIEAWERGDKKLFIPLKFKNGRGAQYSEECIASLERFGALSRHIKKTLTAMSGELHRGSIAADPYYHTQSEIACSKCDFFDVCHFSNGENGENFRYLSKLSPEKAWALIEGGEDNE